MFRQFLNNAKEDIAWLEPSNIDVAIYVVAYTTGYFTEQIIVGIACGVFKVVVKAPLALKVAKIGTRAAEVIRRAKAGKNILDGAQNAYAALQTLRNRMVRRFSSFVTNRETVKKISAMIDAAFDGVDCPTLPTVP